MWPKHLCISDNLLVAPRIYLQRYPKNLRQSSKSVENCHCKCMYFTLAWSFQGFWGAFSILEVISPNNSGPYVSHCTISFQVLICSKLTVCYDRVLWHSQGSPSCLTFRSSTPALTGANSQVLFACLYVFQLTAILSQSGEITPTSHTVAGPSFRQRGSLYCQKQQTNI